MSKWWEKKRDDETKSPPLARAIAYYRHSAQDRQENSISLQQDQVRSWALENRVEIIEEFIDRGKSGLTAEGRPAFNDMMENWVRKRKDFQYILCLDVSRWGRFQDIDLSAQYSAECKRNGKLVIYTSIGMPREGDPLYPVYVQFERFRAAQYSRELSDKVFRGCVKISEQGYWAGGKPPFGLQRMLLNEKREPLQVLKRGERKSIQNQRVTLVRGDEQEVRTICEIFRELTELGSTLQKIADRLNRDGIKSPGGRDWDRDKVRNILTNEKYVGTMVYNQTTQKLSTPTRANPPNDWIRAPDAFDGLVRREVFDRAREILLESAHQFQPAALLERLRELLDRHGMVCSTLIRGSDRMASPSTYTKHFGSLNAAIQMLFSDLHRVIRDHVQQQIVRLATHVEAYDDFLVVNGQFTVLVQPSVPVAHGLTHYWFFQPDQRPAVDITVGVLVSAAVDAKILGYLVFPRLLTAERRVRVFSTSESQLARHGHSGLGFIEQLAGGRNRP